MLPDDDRPFDLRAQWRAVVRRPWLVVLGAVLGAAATMTTVDRAQTTYTAQAQLEVQVVPGTTTGPGRLYAESQRLRSYPVLLELQRRRPNAGLDWRPSALRGSVLLVERDDMDARLAVRRLNEVVDAYLVVRSRQLSEELTLRIADADLELSSARLEMSRLLAGGSDAPSPATNPSLAADERRVADAAALGGTASTRPAAWTPKLTLESAQARLAAAEDLLTKLKAAKAAGPVVARVTRAPHLIGATAPQDPTVRTAAAGALAGGLVGLAACLLVEKARDRVRGRRDAAATAGPVPVLAVLPSAVRSRRNGGATLFGEGAGPAVTESVRALAASLGRRPAGTGARTLLVAGVDRGSDAAALASALACALAGSETRVVALDADLRRPALHDLLEVHERRGLVDAVAESADPEGGAPDLRSFAQPVAAQRGLWVVAAGRPTSDPGAIVASKHLDTVVGRLRSRANWLVVTAPPVLEVADSIALGALLDPSQHDGVLVVASAGRTTHRALAIALDTLAQAAVPLLGVVVSEAHPADCPSYVGGRADQ